MNPLHERRLLADLRRLPQFKITDRKYWRYQCRSFYIRCWVETIVILGAPNEQQIIIDFSQKKTFDRWANSSNFVIDNWNCESNYRPDLVSAHLWMEKVCRSKLFDFNCYFSTISVPFGKSVKNRSALTKTNDVVQS